MSEVIKLLDHGYIMLVDHMGSDLSVVRSARVSYDAIDKVDVDKEADAKLINYLWNNGHTSPFEHVAFTFQAKVPIFVLRQWLRHRTQRPNERSGRYKVLPREFYIPEVSKIGKQSSSNKQMRDIDVIDQLTYQKRAEECKTLLEHNNNSFDLYDNLLQQGWPRELARTVLPKSTYSEIVVTVDLHNLLKFIDQRSHEHAQYEIQVYAEAILKLIEPIVPITIQAWRSTNLARDNLKTKAKIYDSIKDLINSDSPSSDIILEIKNIMTLI